MNEKLIGQFDLQQRSDAELILLRAALDVEMKKRKVPFDVGTYGESLAIRFFQKTPKMPNLQEAPRGTKNVDALSRDGERYSIKTIRSSKKTGTIYPDDKDKAKQLFEYILVVRLSKDWSLESIYQFTWADFLKVRSWDKRMNAWYIGISGRTINQAKPIYQATDFSIDSD